MTSPRKLVIFGAADFAERAKFYFETFSNYQAVCFSVDKAFRAENEFVGLPVVAFENIAERCPPEDHDLYAAIGYRDLNATRRRVCTQAMNLGYNLASCVASSAVIHDSTIGPGSMVFDNVTVGPFVTAGSGLVVAPNSVVGHHSTIGDFTYVSGGVTISGNCKIGAQAFIGAGSIVRDGVTVVDGAFVGMGSVVTKDIREPGVYYGQPARKLKDQRERHPPFAGRIGSRSPRT